MIKTLLHGFYDDAGVLFANNLDESDHFNIVHWVGHKGDQNGRRKFDCYIVDQHIGKLHSGGYEYDSVCWAEVCRNKKQILKEMIRHRYISNLEDSIIDHLIFNRMCYYRWLLNSKNVDLVVFGNIPHEGFDTILYRVAIAMGIKVRIFFNIPAQYMKVISRVEDVGDLDDPVEDPEAAQYDLSKVCSLDYMVNATRGNQKYYQEKIYHKLLLPPSKALGLESRLLRWLYSGSGLSRSELKIYCKFRKRLLRATSCRIPFKKFVYLPLHLQPEMTTCALGGDYDDQALMIEHLREWLPDEYGIVLKENPKQGKRFPRAADRLYRTNNFFKRIKKLPMTCIIPQETDSIKLIKKSAFTVTVTGTAGVEALVQGKNCLVFGLAWYRKFHGVHEWQANPRFEQLVKGVNKEKLTIDCSRYLNSCINLDKLSSEQKASEYMKHILFSLNQNVT